MTYYALLSSIFIYAALGTADIQSSQGDLQLTDNSTQLTLEYRLRLLEETLLVNGMTEGDSVEKRLLQLERTLLAANVRVNQLELKLRRATTLPIAKDSSSDDTQGTTVLNRRMAIRINLMFMMTATKTAAVQRSVFELPGVGGG
jgi:uncharacterized membrane-anchored protein